MMETRKLIDVAIDPFNKVLVKYEYTKRYDASITGEQVEKVYIGEWEKVQSINEALRNDKTNK